MLAKLGLVVAAPFLFLALIVGTTGLVIVEVDAEDGPHLVIPVPLILAQAGLAFAPKEAQYVDCPEFGPYAELAEKILEELAKEDDFILVEVQERNEHVLVQKKGKHLVIQVTEGNNERVECTVPIKGALSFLRSYDGHGFSTRSAISALRHARRGTVVEVQDDEDHIKVRFY